MTISTVYATSLTYDEAYSRIITSLTTQGASIGQREPGVIAGHMVRHKRPSIILGVILLCLFIIPGIIYFIVAGKDQPEGFTIQVGQNVGEPTSACAQGQGTGYKAALQAVSNLPR